MQHLGPQAVEDAEADARSVLGRVDVYAEQPFAERRVDHLYDGIGNRGHVCIGRHDLGEGLLHLLAQSRVGPGLVLGDDRDVTRDSNQSTVRAHGLPVDPTCAIAGEE